MQTLAFSAWPRALGDFSRYVEPFQMVFTVKRITLVVALVAMLSPKTGGAQCIDYGDYLHVVGVVETPGEDQMIAVSGTHAYVVPAAGDDEYLRFEVIDIANPRSPRVVGRVWSGTLDSALGVAVSGGFAYVAAGSSGLQVIDVTNPQSPPR